MITAWVVRAMAAALLLGAASLAGERVSAWYGRPRRWVWAGAMAASLMLPLVGHWGPAFMAPRVADVASITPVVSQTSPRAANIGIGAVAPRAFAPSGSARTIDARGAAGLAWIGMSLAMFACIVAGYVRLRRARDVAAVDDVHGVAVRVAGATGPAVIGLVHPAIVVPRWVMHAPEDERRLIILHEREHIAGKDQWLLAFGTLAVIVMPWNVVLWWQHLRLRLAVETDCDARVLARGTSRDIYGHTLIRTAGDTMPLSMLAPAWGDPASHLTQRILAMTARPPRARFALASTLTVLAIALTLVACAATGTPRVEAGVAPPAPASQPKTTASAASRTPSSSRSRAPADVARSREADVRAASATTRAQTLYGLPGPGYVRVLGYSRDQMPARLFIAAGDAHFEVDRGTATVRGDTLEVTTPAVVRVVPGNSPAYRVVAEAVERGAEVEIQGTAPTGYGAPRAGSARGPAPAMIFRRDAASLATSLKADQAARGKAIQDVRAAVVAQAAARATTVDSRAAGSLEPGTIRVESMNGDRVRVRVSSTISFQARGAGIGYDRSDSSMTILTPTNITLNGSGDFAVVLEPLDAAAGIYVSARGRDGDGFVGAHAWTGGQTNDAKDAWSAIVVCSSKGTSGISGAAPGTKASMAKCE